MKALIKYSIDKHQETINLEDWGHDEETKWDDLPEDEKNYIRDSLLEQMYINCYGADYDY